MHSSSRDIILYKAFRKGVFLFSLMFPPSFSNEACKPRRLNELRTQRAKQLGVGFGHYDLEGAHYTTLSGSCDTAERGTSFLLAFKQRTPVGKHSAIEYKQAARHRSTSRENKPEKQKKVLPAFKSS